MGYAKRQGNNEHYLPQTSTGQLSSLPPSRLAEFINKYYPRKSAEWMPDYSAGIGKSRLDLSELNVIYRTTHGVMPDFAGHVPGYNYKCGETFGRLTVDAKRWLRLHKD